MPNTQSGLLLPLLLLLLSHCSSTASIYPPPSPDPTPAPWPEQFHSVLLSNNSGALSLIDLWYDWPNGRNFNIIRNQLAGPPVHDLEWNNGTSFIYTLPDAPSPSCRTLHFPVGILRPNWLDGAAYLGRASVNGFLCNIWEKADFIRYYEDAATRRPVHWIFYTGMAEHVMTFDVGAVLGDKEWQAPAYCFGNGVAEEAGDTSGYEGLEDMALRRSLRALASVPSMAEGVAQ